VTPPEEEPIIVVSNEFAAIAVQKVATRNGERLEIRSLGHDQAVRLDALALEALTWSNPLEVGKGLETPLGPDPSEPHGPGDEQ
jgi:nitrogen fixation protein